MALPSDASESRPTAGQPGGKGAANSKGKSAKPVKVSFYLPAQLELSLRLALINLEIAGEPHHKLQLFMTELLRRELAQLAKTKKVDFSLMQHPHQLAGRDADSSQARPAGAA